MDILAKLFGTVARVKIMRLFLLNSEDGFETKDVAERSRVDVVKTRKELSLLSAAGFIKKKQFKKTILQKKAKKQIIKKVSGWVFNQSFEYKDALYNVLIDAEFIDLATISERFHGAGKIKLMLVSGVFTKYRDARVDLLIVGNNLKKGVIDHAIKLLESEIGKELSYALFEVDEFMYRAHMYDKLVRDIVDYQHHVVVDQGILTQIPHVRV